MAAELLIAASQQARRKRFVAFSLVTHAFNVSCVGLTVLLGWLAPVWLAVFAIVSLVSAGVFYVTVDRGWNLRLREPSLVFPQLVFGISMAIAMMSQMTSPIGRGLLALTGMVSISYGASTLDRRRLLALMAISAAESALMTAYVTSSLSESEARMSELALLAVIMGAALQVCVYGSVQAALRTKIRERSKSLDHALQQLREANVTLEAQRDMAASQAARDDLTGLFNRRHLERELDTQIARSSRRGSPFAVAMLDIDHFKKINDRLGHGAGDEALRHVADVLSRNIRGGDVFGRYGGEEFLLIMPDTALPNAELLCNRLRDAVRSSRPDAIDDAGPITLSGGLVQFRNGETCDDLVRRADIALYQAKTGGRNRITTR